MDILLYFLTSYVIAHVTTVFTNIKACKQNTFHTEMWFERMSSCSGRMKDKQDECCLRTCSSKEMRHANLEPCRMDNIYSFFFLTKFCSNIVDSVSYLRICLCLFILSGSFYILVSPGAFVLCNDVPHSCTYIPLYGISRIIRNTDGMQ